MTKAYLKFLQKKVKKLAYKKGFSNFHGTEKFTEIYETLKYVQIRTLFLKGY